MVQYCGKSFENMRTIFIYLAITLDGDAEDGGELGCLDDAGGERGCLDDAILVSLALLLGPFLELLSIDPAVFSLSLLLGTNLCPFTIAILSVRSVVSTKAV